MSIFDFFADIARELYDAARDFLSDLLLAAAEVLHSAADALEAAVAELEAAAEELEAAAAELEAAVSGEAAEVEAAAEELDAAAEELEAAVEELESAAEELEAAADEVVEEIEEIVDWLREIGEDEAADLIEEALAAGDIEAAAALAEVFLEDIGGREALNRLVTEPPYGGEFRAAFATFREAAAFASDLPDFLQVVIVRSGGVYEVWVLAS